MDVSKLKQLKKTKVLILGSNGFIGKAVSNVLRKNSLFSVTSHVRKKNGYKFPYIDCAYNSDEFLTLINENDIIILSAGVGLSKLHRSNESNLSIVKIILDRINDSRVRPKLIYLSSMKAYNPKQYNDIYSHDKYHSELLIKKRLLKDDFCIIRLPAVFGKNDQNLKPLYWMSACNLILSVKSNDLPEINFIGINTLAYKIMDLIITGKIAYGGIVYILNTSNITWNSLMSYFNFIKNRSDKFVSLKSIKKIWAILSMVNFFSLKRCLLPEERFCDFFMREWEVQYDSKVECHYISQNLLSAIEEI